MTLYQPWILDDRQKHATLWRMLSDDGYTVRWVWTANRNGQPTMPHNVDTYATRPEANKAYPPDWR